MGRPKVRLEEYTRRSINFDDKLWEELLGRVSRINDTGNWGKRSVTELVHDVLYNYLENPSWLWRDK